jgi:methyl-accepting chemotaxis protein
MLRNYPIKQRLMINGVVVGVAMLVMLALLIMQNRQLSNLADLRLEVSELKAGVLELRKHEKDFVMRQDKGYLDKFNSSNARRPEGTRPRHSAAAAIPTTNQSLSNAIY